MNENQKQQTDDEELIPRKTGNDQLDRLLNETAAIPLAISSEELFHMLPKQSAVANSTFKNIKWILGSAILLTALVLYMLLPLHKNENNISTPLPATSIKENVTSTPSVPQQEIQVKDAGNNIPNTVSSLEKNISMSKITSKAADKNQIFIEGTTTVILEHDQRPVTIELNPSGVKKIVDDGKLISSENYEKYNSLIEEAYAKTSYKYTHEEISRSEKEKVAEAIIQNLYKEKLLSEGQSYDLTLTAKNAVLNEITLSEENHLKMLDILKETTGKDLPEKGRIHIKH